MKSHIGFTLACLMLVCLLVFGCKTEEPAAVVQSKQVAARSAAAEQLLRNEAIENGIQKLHVGMTPTEVKEAFSPSLEKQFSFICSLASTGPVNASLDLGYGHNVEFKDSKLVSFR